MTQITYKEGRNAFALCPRRHPSTEELKKPNTEEGGGGGKFVNPFQPL